MKPKIDEILDILLIEVIKGRSIEDCLREYPEFADELKPLLKLAANIQDLPKPEPHREAIAATLREMNRVTTKERQKEIRFPFRKIFTLKPVIARAIAVILFVIFIVLTSLPFSANSLPGDPLYPVKLLSEKTKYIITINRERKAELHLLFAEKRTEELLLTFKEGTEINKDLLSAMLNEAQSAFKYSESLPAEHSEKFIGKINKCNRYQMGVLQKIKPLVYSSDAAVINEALTLCSERHHCIECKLNPELNNECSPCRCWEKYYIWEQ